MTKSEKPERTVQELLAQALESLTSDERQRVTAWFLSRSSGVTSSLATLGRRQNEELLHVLAPNPESFRELYGRSPGGSQQVVPVRLPADLHARLRLWCADHGFSMATVVRGLVARFLDGQAPVEP
jgi:hypothetical protein